MSMAAVIHDYLVQVEDLVGLARKGFAEVERDVQERGRPFGMSTLQYREAMAHVSNSHLHLNNALAILQQHMDNGPQAITDE